MAARAEKLSVRRHLREWARTNGLVLKEMGPIHMRRVRQAVGQEAIALRDFLSTRAGRVCDAATIGENYVVQTLLGTLRTDQRAVVAMKVGTDGALHPVGLVAYSEFAPEVETDVDAQGNDILTTIEFKKRNLQSLAVGVGPVQRRASQLVEINIVCKPVVARGVVVVTPPPRIGSFLTMYAMAAAQLQVRSGIPRYYGCVLYVAGGSRNVGAVTLYGRLGFNRVSVRIAGTRRRVWYYYVRDGRRRSQRMLYMAKYDNVQPRRLGFLMVDMALATAQLLVQPVSHAVCGSDIARRTGLCR